MRHFRHLYTHTYVYFNISISFPGLLSQSSFVQGDFKCSFKSCKVHLKITTVVDVIAAIRHFEINLESIQVHNMFEANFVIF